MKLILVILVILIAVVLFVLFGPAAKPQPVASPAQPAITGGPRLQPGAPPVAQTPPPLSPRQQGALSAPAQATGVTTETVNLGGGGAMDAKRYMTNKLNQVNPSGGRNNR